MTKWIYVCAEIGREDNYSSGVRHQQKNANTYANTHQQDQFKKLKSKYLRHAKCHISNHCFLIMISKSKLSVYSKVTEGQRSQARTSYIAPGPVARWWTPCQSATMGCNLGTIMALRHICNACKCLAPAGWCDRLAFRTNYREAGCWCLNMYLQSVCNILHALCTDKHALMKPTGSICLNNACIVYGSWHEKGCICLHVRNQKLRMTAAAVITLCSSVRRLCSAQLRRQGLPAYVGMYAYMTGKKQNLMLCTNRHVGRLYTKCILCAAAALTFWHQFASKNQSILHQKKQTA